jgi:myo-inositol-1(or 4)-monophosphatase
MTHLQTQADPAEDRCGVAREIVREAGLHARTAFESRDGMTVSTKGTQDWVTNVDVEVEALIRKRLEEALPGAAVLGEENGGAVGDGDAALWVVDPIDGTTCFMLGIPQWCVVLAHVVGGEPEVAAIYDPMADEMYHATRDGGAFCNGRPISASSTTSVRAGLISVGASAQGDPAKSTAYMERLVSGGGMYLRIGACALALCYVASGRLLAMHEPRVSPWDDLAGLLIVREAGGRTSPYPAKIDPDNRHPVLAAAAGIWPEVEALL